MLLDSDFSGRLCLVLAHSLWQAAAVAVVVGGLSLAMRRWSAQVRYTLHLAGLLVVLAAFPLTFVVVGASRSAISAAPIASSAPPEAEVDGAAVLAPAVVMMEGGEIAAPAESTPAVTARAAWWTGWARVAPWVAALYLVGVAAMAVRLAGGMWAAGRISRRAADASGEIVGRLHALARQWRLRIVPRLAVSAEVVVPKVVGLVRPVILLPLSATTGLTADQLEMILTHELAHVRRHDLWVNLLQRVAETLLFFNPGVWYLSRRLTTLREEACDELVCAGLDPHESAPTARYAAALVRVAELSQPRFATDIATLAATGKGPSELRRRVARLVGEPLQEQVRLTPAGGAVAALAITVMLAGPIAWQSADEMAAARVGENYDASDAPLRTNPTALGRLKAALGEENFSYDGDALSLATNRGRRQGTRLPKATPDVLAVLEDMPHLKVLELSSNETVDDEALVHLRGLRNLNTLYLYRTEVRGPGLVQIEKLPNLEHIELGLTPLEDAGLVHLGKIPRLKSLRLERTSITDTGLAHVAGAASLETLSLRNTQISDDAIEHLEELSGLKELDLTGTQVTAEGVERIRKALPNCHVSVSFGLGKEPFDVAEIPFGPAPSAQDINAWLAKLAVDGRARADNTRPGNPVVKLSLFQTILSDGSILRLVELLPELEELIFRDSLVGDELLEGLAEYPQLTDLYLYNSRVTDQGLTHLWKFQSLRQLSLWGNRITDAGLPHLYPLGKLEYLELEDTQVTEEGVRLLRLALPDFHIID